MRRRGCKSDLGILGFEVFDPVKLVGFVGPKISICEFSPGFANHCLNKVVPRHFKTRNDVIYVGFRGSYFGSKFRLSLAGFFKKFL